MRPRAAAAAGLALLVAGLVPGGGGTATGAAPRAYGDATTLASGDFDGDGDDDLAIGVPREDLGGKKDVGAVHVLYATADGLRGEGSQFWHQGAGGVPGVNEANDGFGRALAAGDFDGDGRDDLAIGAPLENIRDRCCDHRDAGAVFVLYGSQQGLRAAGSDLLHQDRGETKGDAEWWDRFGWALAAGDFDGDGRDDLAVGVPGEDAGSGAVQVFRGSRNGLTRRDVVWHQNSAGVPDAREADDAFGSALAAGNLGYSSREDDLAIGIPGEDFPTQPGGFVRDDAGAVQILYGQPVRGLVASSPAGPLLEKGTVTILDTLTNYGWALAIADFGRAAQEDLAIGLPGDGSTYPLQGAVWVYYGGSYGVSADDVQTLRVGMAGVDGTPAFGARFGSSLAAADFDDFSQADLAIGAPGTPVGGALRAGAVHVVHGGPAGLRAEGAGALADQVWTRASLGTVASLEPPKERDLLGLALAAGSFGGGGADLAVAMPGMDWPGGTESGGAFVLYGRDPFGLGLAGSQLWNQGSAIGDEPEDLDKLGGA